MPAPVSNAEFVRKDFILLNAFLNLAGFSIEHCNCSCTNSISSKTLSFSSLSISTFFIVSFIASITLAISSNVL